MIFKWSLISIVCLLAATCGHKGPLYLPEDQIQQGQDSARSSLLRLDAADDL